MLVERERADGSGPCQISSSFVPHQTEDKPVVQRILEASKIESLDPSAIPRLRMPERATVFSARAARLLQLADVNNPISGYLRLMAALADSQQRAR
nr:formate dehydrogenase accessory protein FdhE [Candidatus Burkholderia verschuerenii]